MITTVLIFILIGLLLFCLYIKEGKPQNFPPGPAWCPLIGNGFLLRKLSKKLKGQHLALSKLGQDYNTSILGLKLGRDLVVVVLNLEANRAVLTRDVFTGRPVSFFMKLRCFGKRQGITSTDGYLWKEQRAFTVKHLKQLGFGKKLMDSLIEDEVKELVHFLREEKVESIGDMTAPSVLNVLWALATGKRVKKSEPKIKKLLKLLNCRSRAFDMAGGTLNQMPWLRFVAPEKTGFSLLQELNLELKKFLMETIEEQKTTFEPTKIRNLIDAFLYEQKFNSKKFSDFSDDELVVLLLDLFLGGAQTTSQTLDFAFLSMITYPDVQEKVHKEIIEAVGRDRLPTMEDKPKLVYTEAVLLEVLRIFCVVPIIGPRRSLEDTTLNGYNIPKNTTILLNLYTVHHDEKLFPDPYVFRPERFISSDGRKLVNHENVLTFGLADSKLWAAIFYFKNRHKRMVYGKRRGTRMGEVLHCKRRCLGEALAKSCLFLIFTGIMQNFQIRKASEDEELSLEPLLGLTLAPKPYSALFKPR